MCVFSRMMQRTHRYDVRLHILVAQGFKELRDEASADFIPGRWKEGRQSQNMQSRPLASLIRDERSGICMRR